MAKLSVIIPYVLEWPQVQWTVASIHEELRGRCDYEIITINNYCPEVNDQQVEAELKKLGSGSDFMGAQLSSPFFKRPEIHMEDDKAYQTFKNAEPLHNWLKVITYDKKLSHWNAKRAGIEKATGDVFWFCDSHCVIQRDSLINMFKTYIANGDFYSTLHAELTYQILDTKRLIYKLNVDKSKGLLHYKFHTRATHPVGPYEVPCMSTCGMMMHRDLYNALGGFPEELGIYGGGENFINFTMAVLGYKKYVLDGAILHHYGEKRGYHYRYLDYHWNRMIALYLAAGEKWIENYVNSMEDGHTQ